MEEHVSHEVCAIGYPVGKSKSAFTPWCTPWCPSGWHMGPPVEYILWRSMGESMRLKLPWYGSLGIPGAPRGTYVPTVYIGHMGHLKEPHGVRRDNSWSTPRRAPSRKLCAMEHSFAPRGDPCGIQWGKRCRRAHHALARHEPRDAYHGVRCISWGAPRCAPL